MAGRLKTAQAGGPVLCLALPLMLLFCAAAWLIQGGVPVLNISSETGVWDLRGVDFSAANVRFSGKVEYIPGALLHAAGIYAREAEAQVADTCSQPAACGTTPHPAAGAARRKLCDFRKFSPGLGPVFVNGVWMDGHRLLPPTPQTPWKGDVLFSLHRRSR